MLFAQDKDGSRIRATPTASAVCPLCMTEMIPKCGEIKVWHWAHKRKDCDGWSDGETDWHLYWKSLMLPDNVEVVIQRKELMEPWERRPSTKRHRADIVTDSGMVVELQHSSISKNEVENREYFYRNMIWLFDVRTQADRDLGWSPSPKGDAYEQHTKQLQLFSILDCTGKPWLFLHDLNIQPDANRLGEARKIRWWNPLASVLAAKKPCYLDVGDDQIFRLMHYDKSLQRGWGYMGTYMQFTDWLIANGKEAE